MTNIFNYIFELSKVHFQSLLGCFFFDILPYLILVYQFVPVKLKNPIIHQLSILMESSFHFYKILIYRITSQVTSHEQVILMRLCFKDASLAQWWEKLLSKCIFIKLTCSWFNKHILWKLLSKREAKVFLCILDWY